MANTTIGIKLNFRSQGQEKVIQNLEGLNMELRELQQILLEADFTSLDFREAQKNIQLLQSFTADLNKSIEGVDKEKRIRAVGASVQALTGSFQVLSGVLSLVITDTESLESVQKAEAFALQTLNIALGVNSVNTAIAEAASARFGPVLKAQALFTNLAARAQAIYNAVLAANPITLVVAGVVALTAALFALVKIQQQANSEETKSAELAKNVLKVENELLVERKKAAAELKIALEILTDNVSTRALELKTIENLKKEIPGLNAFVSANNSLTSEGIELLKLKIQLQEAETILAKVREKQADAEIKYEQDLFTLQSEGVSLTERLIGLATRQVPEFNKLVDITLEYTKSTAGLNEVEKQQTQNIEKLLQQYSPFEKALQEQAKREGEAAKNTAKNNDVLTSKGKLLQSITKLIKGQNDELKSLLEVELEYTADVLDMQTKILEDQAELLGKRSELLRDTGEELQKQINQALLAIVPTDEALKNATDKYQELFDFVSNLYTTGVIRISENLTPQGLANRLDEELRGVFENLSGESQATLLDFFNELETRITAIQSIRQKIGIQQKITLENTLQDTLTLSEAEDEIYNLFKDRLDLGLTLQDVEKQSLQIVLERFGLTEQEKKLQEELAKARTNQDKQAAKEALDAFKEFETTLLLGIQRSIKFYEGVETITAKSVENLTKIKQQTGEITRQFTDAELAKLSAFFEENISNIDDIVFEVFNNLQKYKERLGEGGLNKVIEGLGKSVKGLDEENRKALESSVQYLETYIAIGKVLGQDVSEAEALLDKTQEQLDQLNTNKFFQNLAKGLEKFNGEVFKLADRYLNILQQRSALFLEQLASDEAAALKAVEGTTERLQEEQALIRKEYAKTRFEVEKKTRLTELRFTLAQTTADSAAAIANTLATLPPPVNFIIAGATGALVAAQILSIRDQITFVQSQQFVGRRGGLISGQSHEGSMGGVPAMLEGGEFVVNRAAVDRYGDIIGDLNSSTGGRKLSIDDSRLVQAISSQNNTSTPIKTYVLYNDIQNTEKLNAKITQLARL